MLAASNRLVSRYIIPDAPLQVNISATLILRLSSLSCGEEATGENVTTIKQEILDALASCEKEIMCLLVMGWFQRFVESPFFVE